MLYAPQRKTKIKNKRVAGWLLCFALVPFLASCGISSLPGANSKVQMQSAWNPTLTPSPTAQPSLVNITVDRSKAVGTSQLTTGLSYADNSLSSTSESMYPAAVENVKLLIQQGIPLENTPIMSWGVADPWPDPSQPEPTNWDTLDSRLQLVLDTHGTPIITLCEAPWWMKGQLQANGTTKLLTAADEWTSLGYTSRILDNKMSAWLHLVQRVAERYMVPPYNVRYFQVWNEMKGYYNPATNDYDYTTSPGDPSGANAKHGYTYMYNQVYARLRQVATSLSINPDSIKIGGPYTTMNSWSSRSQAKPSHISEPFGVLDQRPLDILSYWLQHKTGAGFITFDAFNGNRDRINLVDPFGAAEKAADITSWIRSLNDTQYPGAKTLPIWLSEWDASPYSGPPDKLFNNAVKAYTMMKFLKAGGSVALEWGGFWDGGTSTGLWTYISDGGQPDPWYYSYKAFKDDFPAGTPLYSTTVSAPGIVEALASNKALMLINKTPTTLTVQVNGTIMLLSPYQVHINTV